MPERSGEIEKAVVAKGKEGKPSGGEIRPSDRELIRRLGEYPELRAKIEAMLAIIALNGPLGRKERDYFLFLKYALNVTGSKVPILRRALLKFIYQR